jgi:hypothetical protein
MSLSSHLDDAGSPVRRFLYEQFPHTRELMAACRSSLEGSETIRRADTSGSPPYGTLGTAIDYRLRYYFGVTPPREFVAATGARMLNMAAGDRRLLGFGDLAPGVGPSEEVRDEFFMHLEKTVEAIRPVARRCEPPDEEALSSCCYVLALFEQVRRNPTNINLELYRLGPASTFARLLQLAAPSWVDDLCRLSWAFYDRHAELCSRAAALNPTFDGSRDIGGADADLIVDGCLLEVKTTTNAARTVRESLRQLLGYVLLDYSDHYQIREVGFYLARQAVIVRWPLEQFLRSISGGGSSPLPDLRKRFQEVVVSAREERAAA